MYIYMYVCILFYFLLSLDYLLGRFSRMCYRGGCDSNPGTVFPITRSIIAH